MFNSPAGCTYVLNGGAITPTGGKYGDSYIGTVGSSTILNGHSLGSACNDGICTKEEVDGWYLQNLQNGDDIFIAIFLGNDLTAMRAYLQTGGTSTPPTDNFGTFTMKWGIEDTESRVENLIYPIDEIIVPSTSVTFEGQYYRTDQTGTTYPLNAIQIELTDEIAGFTREYLTIENLLTSTTTLNNFATTTTLLTDHAYRWRARLINKQSIDDFGAFGVSTSYTEQERFFIITDPYASTTQKDPFDESFAFNLATSTCDFFNITGCFQNALVFAFVPSESVFNGFLALKDEIQNKPPFGYIAILITAFNDVSSETSPAFTLASENNITDSIFTPIKTGLAWILWFAFGIWLYKRVRSIDI